MLRRTISTGFCAAATAGLALAENAGEHEEPSLFNADIGNFIFTLIIFGLVIYILGRFAWRPLLKVLHEREVTIRDSLEAARQERDAAQRLLAEYQAHLNKAREEASAIVEEGRRDAEAARRRMQEETRRQNEEMIERAKREIRLATDAARKELFDKTAELAVSVAGRIIAKELRPQDHQALVRESVARMEEAEKARSNGH